MNSFETSDTAVAPADRPDSPLLQDLGTNTTNGDFKTIVANATKGSEIYLPPIELVHEPEKNDSTSMPLVGDKVAWGKTNSTEAVNRCSDSVHWWIRNTGNPLGATADCNRHLNNSTDVNDAAYLWNIGPGKRVYNDIGGSYQFKAGMSRGQAYMYKGNPN